VERSKRHQLSRSTRRRARQRGTREQSQILSTMHRVHGREKQMWSQEQGIEGIAQRIARRVLNR
jgi:hypothetical protein